MRILEWMHNLATCEPEGQNKQKGDLSASKHLEKRSQVWLDIDRTTPGNTIESFTVSTIEGDWGVGLVLTHIENEKIKNLKK